jgi:hypothetical protein
MESANRIGCEVLGRVVTEYTGKWLVTDASNVNSWSGVLNSKSSRLYKVGDEDEFWVYGELPSGQLLLSDSDFGRFPISDRMRPRYVSALTTALRFLKNNHSYAPNEAVHFSELKGMFNRCVRRDQWDWFSVYDAFGQPCLETLRNSAEALGSLARNLKSGSYEEVTPIAEQLRRWDIVPVLERGLAVIRNTTPRLSAATTFEVSCQKEGGGSDEDTAVQQDPYIFSRIARAKMERANSTHRSTLTLLVSHLEGHGYLVEYSKLIDAYTRLKNGPAIFEVKSITETNERAQCRHALAQLYEYRFLHSVPNASLWLVLSQPPRAAWLINYLQNDRDINVLWREGTSFAGPTVESLTKNLWHSQAHK